MAQLIINSVIVIVLALVQIIVAPQFAIAGAIPDIAALWALLAIPTNKSLHSLTFTVVAALSLSSFSTIPTWVILAQFVAIWGILWLLNRYLMRDTNLFVTLTFAVLITLFVHLPLFAYNDIHFGGMLVQLAINLVIAIFYRFIVLKRHVQASLDYTY